MRYLRPDIHNIFKLFTLQFIIIVAIILGAFQANAFSQNSITTPPNALEQDLSEYGCSIHSLSTDSLFRLGTNFLNKNVQSPDSALICYITAQNRLGKEHDIKMISAIAKSFINTAYVYSLKYFDYAEAYLNLKKAENICTENNLDSLLSIVQHSLATLRNRVFSRMFQLLCSFYSCNILYISKIPSIKSLIFELNFTMFFNIVLLHRITNVYQELMAIHS